jgi:hypothetical protein
MPKNAIRQEFELSTRSSFTKVECDISLSVNGRELPSLAVLGKALEDAVSLIQTVVSDSYKKVPERVEGTTGMGSQPQLQPQSVRVEPPKPAIPFG